MNGDVELVVTDLDGTLWSRSNRVHRKTLSALEALARHDIPVLVATSRRPGSARRILDANDLCFPAVLFDGALGRDLRNGSCFHRHAFDAGTASDVLNSFTELGIEPCVNVVSDSEVDAYLGASPATHDEHVRFIEPWVQRAHLGDIVSVQPVLSFVVCGVPAELLRPVANSVDRLAAATITPDPQYGEFGISVRPKGVDKWEGVASFCAQNGLDGTKVLAIGDGENDVELLSHAAIPCAIDGSCDNLVAQARHLIGRPEDGGWARVADLVL